MPRRQVAMVIDLNKCIGCQSCSTACKTLWTDEPGQEYMLWNNVETKPGPGYPVDWEKSGGGWENGRLKPGQLVPKESYGTECSVNNEEVLFLGTAEQLKQTAKMKTGWNWDEDTSSGQYPNNYHFYLPRLCNHCTKPACLEACPVRAIYKREEDGIVLIDQDKCQGIRACNVACPYKKIYYNYVTKKSQKCIFCFPRLEQGYPPACARQCPGRLRFVGFLEDEDGPIHKLVYQWKVALPLHPEYGTEPNVYYVPPIRWGRCGGGSGTAQAERCRENETLTSCNPHDSRYLCDMPAMRLNSLLGEARFAGGRGTRRRFHVHGCHSPRSRLSALIAISTRQ